MMLLKGTLKTYTATDASNIPTALRLLLRKITSGDIYVSSIMAFN